MHYLRIVFVAVLSMTGAHCSPQEYLPDAPLPTFVVTQSTSYSSSLQSRPKPLGDDTSVKVSRAEFREDQVTIEEHQRLFGIVPNFYAVYGLNAAPLTTKQKFHLAWKSELDPENLSMLALNAAMEKPNTKKHSRAVAQHYPTRAAIDWAQEMGGAMFGKVLLSMAFHEDPRFFYRDTASKWSRIWYSVWSDFTTRNDKGSIEPAYSAFASDLVSHASMNLFYKPDQRIPVGTITREILMGRLSGIGDNLAQEFIFHRFTPKRRRIDQADSTRF